MKNPSDILLSDSMSAGGHNKSNYDSEDNTSDAFVVPLTPDQWTNVFGQQDPNSFYAPLGNIGWIGVTFGGDSLDMESP